MPIKVNKPKRTVTSKVMTMKAGMLTKGLPAGMIIGQLR